jgi:ATP-dependent helicase/nuclease subunit B
VPAAATAELLYVRLMDPALGGRASSVGTQETSPDQLAKAIGTRLVTLLDAYRAGLIGFRSRVVPFKERDRSAYDHLARVLEWSTAGEDGGENGGDA